MLAACVLPVLIVAQSQRPINPNEPPPQGQRLEANDGDTVVIRTGARVRIVHRSDGTARLIYNAATRSLTILVDRSNASGAPDGTVDGSYRFDGLDGAWPLAERWQGRAVIDEYQMPQGTVHVGMGISTDAGLIQLFSGAPSSTGAQAYLDSRAVAVLHYRSGGGGGLTPGMDFDRAEQYVAQQAQREAGMGSGIVGSVRMSAGESAPGGVILTTPGSGLAPVRVGGSIRMPRKIVDAQPVYPAIAQSARVQGVVILEITIAADGTVQDAKVLRSIPLLDQAALDCVRQWKYEPTQLNGASVPVILTATVNFTLQNP